jgi:DNA-binding CsgD family transcriptional regulator
MLTRRQGATTREQVLRLTRAGLTPRQIAVSLGLSTQAIYQHITKLRELGELPPKEES